MYKLPEPWYNEPSKREKQLMTSLIVYVCKKSMFGRKAVAVLAYVPLMLYIVVRHSVDAVLEAVDNVRYEMRKVNTFYKHLLTAKTNNEVDDVISAV